MDDEPALADMGTTATAKSNFPQTAYRRFLCQSQAKDNESAQCSGKHKECSG